MIIESSLITVSMLQNSSVMKQIGCTEVIIQLNSVQACVNFIALDRLNQSKCHLW